MDRKTLYIGLLSLSATGLLLLNYFGASPVSAQVSSPLSIKDRDFSMVTARTQAHGDALYIMDNHTGRIAVLTYDAASHLVRPHAFRDLPTIFAGTNLPAANVVPQR